MAMPIKCKALVAWGPSQPLKLEIIEVAPPKKDEVRIKVEYTSVCKSDIFGWRGDDSLTELFPCILGHESSGTVESVGEGVTHVQPGDKVVPFFLPHCKECSRCHNETTNVCEQFDFARTSQDDGTNRFTCKGKKLFSFLGISTFTEYTVMSGSNVAKVDPSAPMEDISIIACGLSTGLGASLKSVNMKEGQTVAIFGLGAVGLAVALGAKIRGASRIIGVDIDDSKFEVSKKFGINEFINPSHHKDKPLHQVIMEQTEGGVDFAFECVGNVKLMQTALESTRLGWGQAIVLGVAASTDMISAAPVSLLLGRVLKGAVFGGWKGRDDVPKLVKMAMDGELQIQDFITHRRDSLEDLNEVFQLLIEGKCLRCVVKVQ